MADRIGKADPGEIVEAAAVLRDRVTALVQRASERLEVERHVQEDPWAVLAVAAGAGFVLGGGLWPALKPLVKMAGRAALSPVNLLAIAAAIVAVRPSGTDDEGTSDEPLPTTH